MDGNRSQGNRMSLEQGGSGSDRGSGYPAGSIGIWWLLLLLLLPLLWATAVAAQPVTAGDPALAASLAREQARLESWQVRLNEVHERRQVLAARQRAVDAQLAQLRRTEASMQEQISVLEGSVLLSRVLQELQASLPSIELEGDLADEIAQWRLLQFDLAPSRALHGGVTEQTAHLLQALPPAAQGPPAPTQLRAVVELQWAVLQDLNLALSDLVQEAVTLQLAQAELQRLSQRVGQTIQEQLFWIPSQPAMNLAWIRSIPAGLQQQLAGVSWDVGWREFWSGLRHQPLLFLPVLLVVGALLARRAWLRKKVQQLNDEVGDVRRDSHWHSALAVLFNVLLALPGTLLLALAGFALQLDGRGQNLALGAALLEMSFVWLVFYTAQRMLLPDGVGVRHFAWEAAEMAPLRRRMIALGAVVFGMVGVVTFAGYHAAALVDDYLGNLIVLVGYGVMAWLMASLLTHTAHRREVGAGRLLGGIVLALMPIVLIVAVVAGYYYTAVHLTDRLVDTLYVLIFWRLLHGLVMRSLAVAERRYAAQQAERPAMVASQGPDGKVVIEEPRRDLSVISAQALRLANLALLAVLLVGLYGVWADLITVFSYLNHIVLYEYTSGSGETATMVPISLRDLLAAGVIAVVAVMLARNLPGLLEVLVLSRMRMAQGSNYAIKTLLSYVIVSVGIVATLSSLGVSWDKLQWLVAALSVGLGFGLQEIFANFVSGLIILFERPVRIGDVVTVGSLSGTVSRIHIRATTIVDFERKEIIVPNKTFVTDQLINWTLSDTVTRVTVTVGVAYGSDLSKVRELLLQIARDNPRVLAEPPPTVWFLNFGASTLDHELRFHVRELRDRLAATDEINRSIDRVFAEHGIEIAFAQMDVHVRSIDGKRARLETIVHQPQGGSMSHPVASSKEE